MIRPPDRLAGHLSNRDLYSAPEYCDKLPGAFICLLYFHLGQLPLDLAPEQTSVNC